tara:strand:- start:231 stop:560 length:330 start_codon:yes stop_codon:yes gene_type:complete
MAQNFKQIKHRNIGTSATSVPNGSNFPTGFHTIIGINMANVSANPITVSAYVRASSANYYIIKDMTIPSGSSFAHDSKIVVLSGDQLNFISSASNTLDVIVSYVQEISG